VTAHAGTLRVVRIATWNINSIRARSGRVLAWLDRHRPEVVCLQETKCTDDHVPFGAFAELGYETAHWGIHHWNGVAILSRVGLTEIRRGFSGPCRTPFDEARLVTARCGDLEVSSVYVPNGRELGDPHYLFKLTWLERLRGELLTAGVDRRPWVVAGDFNVAPADIDIYAPERWRRRTHASPPERAAIGALLDLGLTDIQRALDPSPGVYTWWNYRPTALAKDQGLRIDLLLTSPPVTDRARAVWVDRDERAGERASDHAPVVLELTD
jgi:exodeoxyribonuclease III